jgi:hypothetical protein
MKEWVKGCDMGFYVGQKVMSERGEGTVISTNNVGTLPITVKIDESHYDLSYMKDGCYSSKDKLPSLYPIELTPKFYQPEWQPKEGEWCWFWDGEKLPTIRRFKSMLPLVSNYRYIDELRTTWSHCAPFDGNMTPPWERGEEK